MSILVTMTEQKRLEIGDQAPAFTLPNDSGETTSLADYQGKRVLVYFYPRANTPGCTTEACDFRDSLAQLNDLGIEVVGISPDTVDKLVAFREKNNLTFPLLADPDKNVLKEWGAFGEKKNYGKIVVPTAPSNSRSTTCAPPDTSPGSSENWKNNHRMDQDAPDILLPRRRPAQQRSRERFNRILASARAVLVDVGFESFTFDEVARRAEVPIGTLYQFFANKYVLICELDRQDTAEIVSELQDFSSRVPALQWPDFLDEFIDHLAGLWRDDPSRRAVWHAVQSTPATRATAAATEQEMLDLIARVMKPLAPGSPDILRRELAGILVHTVSSLLNYAVRDKELDDARFSGTVAEIKRMLVAYLFAVATG